MKKAFLTLLALAVLFTALPATAMAAPVQNLNAESPSLWETPEYYGRAALAELDAAKEMLYAYDAISAGVDAMDAEIAVYDGEHYLSQDELDVVLDAYRRDRADHFWLSNEYSIKYNDNTVTKFVPSYLFDKSLLEAKKNELEGAVCELIGAIPSIMGEQEREIALHDALASRVVYDLDAPNAHNAYGALVEGKAVCEGYAEALQILLFGAGIQSFLATGSSLNPTSGASEGHEWNYVRIEGKYYHVDLTWNDQEDSIYHAYLNISDARISEDHAINAAGFALPTCADEEQNYFATRGGMISEYSVASVAAVLRENALSASFFLPSIAEKNTFKSWVSENVRDIATELSITGSYSYYLTSIGCEVMIFFDGYCAHTNATFVDEEPASCESAGRRAHYSCPDCSRKYLDGEFKNAAVEQTLYIAPLQHAFTDMIEDEAHLARRGTCKEKHKYYYACARCDAVSTTETFVGSTFGEHEYGEYIKGSSLGHYRICLVCAVQSETEEHLPSIPSPTETDAVRCTDCGYVITPALGHTEHTRSDSYNSTDLEHWRTCTDCEERFDTAAHSYDAECDPICNACGRARSAEHDYSRTVAEADGHKRVCECGATTELEAHTDSDADGTCDACERRLTSGEFSMSAIFDLIGAIFASARLDGDATVLLTVTLIASAAVIALIIILSRVFNGRR